MGPLEKEYPYSPIHTDDTIRFFSLQGVLVYIRHSSENTASGDRAINIGIPSMNDEENIYHSTGKIQHMTQNTDTLKRVSAFQKHPVDRIEVLTPPEKDSEYHLNPPALIRIHPKDENIPPLEIDLQFFLLTKFGQRIKFNIRND